VSKFERLPIFSSSLSDHFFLRVGFGPRNWRELSYLGDLGRRQACEQILEYVKRKIVDVKSNCQKSLKKIA
jgi:hypothetical protein